MSTPNRAEALALFLTHNDDPSLIKHALMVEAVMRAFAKERNLDPDYWGLIGLVHDIDWQRYPESHCFKAREILLGSGWPEDMVRAVMSHGFGLVTEVEPILEMERVLWTIDELTGFVAASALVRPSKSLHDLEARSVRKKWKEKSFAAGVNREIIERGADKLGLTLDELITRVIAALRPIAADIGLQGSATL